MEPGFAPSLDNYLRLTPDLLQGSSSRCRCVSIWAIVACVRAGSCHPQHSLAAIPLMSRCCGGMVAVPPRRS